MDNGNHKSTTRRKSYRGAKGLEAVWLEKILDFLAPIGPGRVTIAHPNPDYQMARATGGVNVKLIRLAGCQSHKSNKIANRLRGGGIR